MLHHADGTSRRVASLRNGKRAFHYESIEPPAIWAGATGLSRFRANLDFARMEVTWSVSFPSFSSFSFFFLCFYLISLVGKGSKNIL